MRDLLGKMSLLTIVHEYYPNVTRQSESVRKYLGSKLFGDIIKDPQSFMQSLEKLPGISSMGIARVRKSIHSKAVELLHSGEKKESPELALFLSKLDSIPQDFLSPVVFSPSDCGIIKRRVKDKVILKNTEHDVTIFADGIPDLLQTEPVWRLINGDGPERAGFMEQRQRIHSIVKSSEHSFNRYVDLAEISALACGVGKYRQLSRAEIAHQIEIIIAAAENPGDFFGVTIVNFADLGAVPSAIVHDVEAFVMTTGGYIRVPLGLMLERVQEVAEKAEEAGPESARQAQKIWEQLQERGAA